MPHSLEHPHEPPEPEPDTTDRAPIVIGELARDTAQDRVGYVIAARCCCLVFQPMCGGREWTCLRDDAEYVSRREALNLRVNEINTLRRWGL